jgi:peptide/nickel transport system substrate-binding protein
MKKEPFIMYVFRIGLGFALVGMMTMVYWSSELVEKDLKSIKGDLEVIKEEVRTMQSQERTFLRGKREVAPAGLPIVGNATAQKESAADLQTASVAEGLAAVPAGDPAYPNILVEDTFYKTTLPKLLPANFAPSGILRTSTVGRPDNLHPFSNWSNTSSWIAQCSVNLAQMEFGRYETMSPDMATKIEERTNKDSGLKEFWVYLRNDVFWEPLDKGFFPDDINLDGWFLKRHPVTAHDYKFYFDAIMNPSVQEAGAASLRNYLDDIQELKVIDDFTFIVRWKGDKGQIKYSGRSLTGGLQPLARFVYQHFPDGSKIIEEETENTYRENSVWAQNFSRHWAKNIIVSCGAWIFDGINEEKIRFRRNSNHYQPLAALVSAMEITFRDTPDQIWQDFKEGKTDLYTLSPDQLIELTDFLASEEYAKQDAAGQKIHRVDYVARAYNYLGWNQKRPYFANGNLRKAMTMAIDRERLINQYLNRMGVEITGPFFVNSPSYNESIEAHPFDVAGAKRLLEQEGWYDSDGNGIRDKIIDGKMVPFSFNLTYYVKNPTSKANCEFFATSLKEIGVDCQLMGVDIADLSSSFDEKGFDAIYLGWALGTPPEEPKQLWHSSGAEEKGSSNAVGFKNGEADKLIDELQYEYDLAKRREMYHRFHEIIHNEEPYTFLYTPKTAFIYRDRVQNVFIPADRQDLIPGANVAEPSSSVFWLKS